MNILSKIIIIFSAFFICGCLNFNTGSVSFNDNGIDNKYYGTYEGSITIKENNNITSQATANVVIGSGSSLTIRITGNPLFSFYGNAYKENIIKISDNVYQTSITSSGNKYDFALSFNNNYMSISFYSSNGISGSGVINKIR